MANWTISYVLLCSIENFLPLELYCNFSCRFNWYLIADVSKTFKGLHSIGVLLSLSILNLCLSCFNHNCIVGRPWFLCAVNSTFTPPPPYHIIWWRHQIQQYTTLLCDATKPSDIIQQFFMTSPVEDSKAVRESDHDCSHQIFFYFFLLLK